MTPAVVVLGTLAALVVALVLVGRSKPQATPRLPAPCPPAPPRAEPIEPVVERHGGIIHILWRDGRTFASTTGILWHLEPRMDACGNEMNSALEREWRAHEMREAVRLAPEEARRAMERRDAVREVMRSFVVEP